MDERSRLGRGLKEISQIYLSDAARDETRRTGSHHAQSGQHTIIRVCHPGSSVVQSFFLANLALELARNQFPVFVWDCIDSSSSGIESLMESLVLEHKETDAATVRLYGLPDILIYSQLSHDARKLVDLVSVVRSSDNDCYLLVNADGSLDSLIHDSMDAEHVLMSRIDEKSLLQCYAHIRVIQAKGNLCRIYIVFDGIENGKAARDTFDRFSSFIERKLQITIHYLGYLSHDEYLQRSVNEAKPLMLFHDRSETKDNMAAISKNLIHSRQNNLNNS